MSNRPIIVVLNHPSWWDPLICTVLSREFGDREHYGAIEAKMLSKYGFFKWLGFFGVESNSLRGAARFLRTSSKLLNNTNRVFWITAQGRFSDVRERPLGLQSGVGHLAARLKQAIILPVGIEYTYWSEKSAEVLIRIGSALQTDQSPGENGSWWTARIESALTETLEDLSIAARSQDVKRFQILLSGRSGVGGLYGIWQRLKAWSRLQKYRPRSQR